MSTETTDCPTLLNFEPAHVLQFVSGMFAAVRRREQVAAQLTGRLEILWSFMHPRAREELFKHYPDARNWFAFNGTAVVPTVENPDDEH